MKNINCLLFWLFLSIQFVRNIAFHLNNHKSIIKLPLINQINTKKSINTINILQKTINSEKTLQINLKNDIKNDIHIDITNDISYKTDMQHIIGWLIATISFSFLLNTFYIQNNENSVIEFFSGYLLEQSLSIDNLFVFVILFNYFKIPQNLQSKVLNYGIFGAIFLRFFFILFGFIAIESFHSILLLFSGILLFSSYKILFKNDENNEEEVRSVYVFILFHSLFMCFIHFS